MNCFTGRVFSLDEQPGADTDTAVYEPVYAAPPAPVVPEEMPKGLAGQIVSLLAHNIGDKFLAQKIWNACRAAMLQGDEPVSETYTLPELIEGMEVSIDVSTCDADAGNRYFGTVTEVSELDTARNGYILLVQDAKPNFDVNGNSPVIPDGYALVPVEPTDEMIAAAMNCEDVLFNSDESFCVQFGNIYEAMLAAAPQPEASDGK
ncbi:Eaa2 [Salmonella enterica]|nr:Eaa2 [Salmonella enterica]